MCDEVVSEFEYKSKDIQNSVPSCSLEKFMTLFENNDPHAFGRGMTLKAEKTDIETVKAHIEWLNNNIQNIGQRITAIMCMKERFTSMGLYELAEQYYHAHYNLQTAPGHSLTQSGNYRPIGY